MSSHSTVCSFALLLPVYHLFDYQVHANMPITPGTRYRLPFGNRDKVGILVQPAVDTGQSAFKLRAVNHALDQQPVLSAHMLQLLRWVADYYCQPVGEVLFQGLPKSVRQSETLGETRVQYWQAAVVDETLCVDLQKKAPRQYQILRAIMDSDDGLDAAQLRLLNESWHQPLKALQQKGLVMTHWREQGTVRTGSLVKAPALTSEQSAIFFAIKKQLQQFLVHLIQGVTGSGKTEIYLALIEQVLKHDRQVIYLVPEIGLTPQLMQRLQQRLGHAVVSSHSAQSDHQRYQSWDQFRRGVARVMIGTRSALFADSDALGLIIIDEEHDSSYRQQDGVRYHARDVAIKRGQMLDIPVILGSATPSLETLHNLEKSHYRRYLLEQRVNQTRPPPIELVDCSQVALQSGCSPRLLKAVEQHLANHGQVLLFLNRRGFAPVVMCHECGWQASCYQCDARMTLHQSMGRLICHHCGYQLPVPPVCPKCQAEQIRHYGIGTEQLEVFLRQRFSDIDVIRIDRDTVTASQTLEHKLQPVRAGSPCILVGTQMLAKGHDYPHITLVGIIDADQALYSSFYRAAERLVQTVLQVSGRAGRAEKKGQALLQTAFPSHPLMQGLCRQSYTELVTPMLDERKLLGFPPFVRVVTLQVDALELEPAIQRLQRLKQALMEIVDQPQIKIIGPIPALMTRRVGRYRAQLSVLAPDSQSMRSLLQQWMPQIEAVKNTPHTRLTIEVDPLDL